MKRLAIIGSGDLGQLIAHHAINDNHYIVIGFFDDFEIPGTIKMSFPVLGKIKDTFLFFKENKFDEIMIGIGYKHMNFRKKIFDDFVAKIPIGKIIHSSSYVDNSVKVGVGVFLLPRSVLDKDVVIGDNILVNTSAVISHDSQIDSHCFIAPCASIAGKVHIHECCFIGINSTIIDNVTIIKNTIVGGGAVVTSNIDKSGIYLGVPAKLKNSYDSIQ